MTIQDIYAKELKIYNIQNQIEKLNQKKQSLDFKTNKVDIFKIELQIWHLNEKINNLKLEIEESKQNFQKQKSIGTKK